MILNDVIYLDFSNVFDKSSHDKFIRKVNVYKQGNGA